MVPLAKILRRRMPAGYTISQFAYNRFNQSKVASGVVTVTMIFGILLEILINLKGTSVVMSTVFPINWQVATLLTVVVVLAYSYFGGLWTSVMTGHDQHLDDHRAGGDRRRRGVRHDRRRRHHRLQTR